MALFGKAVEDDKWQREQRDAILVPKFYDVRWPKKYRFTDGDVELQRQGVDTVVEDAHALELTIDEKIVHWPGYAYKDFALETVSCSVPGRESVGWMTSGRSDYILYCMQQPRGDLWCHLIEFRPLKKWFYANEDRFPPFGPLNTMNRSMGKRVPIIAVRQNVPCEGFLLKVDDGQADRCRREIDAWLASKRDSRSRTG